MIVKKLHIEILIKIIQHKIKKYIGNTENIAFYNQTLLCFFMIYG